MTIDEEAKRLPIEDHCAGKLRSLRQIKGLTLEECETVSEGKFKAVVLGSYERGTRAISLAKLSQLADFYDVPISYFFSSKRDSLEGRWVFDLRRHRERNDGAFPLNFIASSLARIAELRSDWAGEFLTVRDSDRAGFEIVFGKDREELISHLKSTQIILNTPIGLQSP
jgi:transcriptional regulator with XRE-family HTH domain